MRDRRPFLVTDLRDLSHHADRRGAGGAGDPLRAWIADLAGRVVGAEWALAELGRRIHFEEVARRLVGDNQAKSAQWREALRDLDGR